MMKTHENRALFSRALLKATTCLFLTAGAGVSSVWATPETTESMRTEMVQQQTVTVSGVVKDRKGEPIIGANIMEKGTTNGTITDFDGKYTLKVKSAQSVLTISYIGYKTQEIPVGNGGKKDITMQDDSELMDEVVVIGYGTQRKGDVTSAISSVKSESFVKGAVTDAGQLIQGKVAGLNISLPSGDPTGNTQIMLRGISSLKGGTSPLVLVDGVPGSLNTVAPEDVESIDVLKDGSATAIYGTRGTNGVIIITTKQSRKEMAPTIDYNGYVSVSNILNRPDFMDADDLRQKWNEGYTFNGANLKDFGANTDWLGELTRTAVSHSHNLSLRGGSKNTNYTASINYTNRQGTFIKTDFEAINGRMDITHSMYDNKLTANVSTFVSQHAHSIIR